MDTDKTLCGSRSPVLTLDPNLDWPNFDGLNVVLTFHYRTVGAIPRSKILSLNDWTSP